MEIVKIELEKDYYNGAEIDKPEDQEWIKGFKAGQSNLEIALACQAGIKIQIEYK